MENMKRRSSDALPGDIDQMIASENDPDKRLNLLILQAIHGTLMETANGLRKLSDKLDDHLQIYDTHTKSDAAVMNKLKGVWLILPAALVVLQILGGYILTEVRKDLDNIHSAIVTGQIIDAKNTATIEAMQDRLDDHLAAPTK